MCRPLQPAPPVAPPPLVPAKNVAEEVSFLVDRVANEEAHLLCNVVEKAGGAQGVSLMTAKR